MEGVVTIGLGLLSFIFMSDYPISARWLTEREKRIINITNEADRALLAEEGFNKKQIISAFTDWRTYLWGLVYLSTYIPVYSVILSLPSVVAGLGYKGTTATLMACPPYGFGFIIVLLAGYTTDRFGRRYWHMVFGCCMTLIGLIVLMSVEDLSVRYGMFFIVMFMFVPIAVEWSWLAGNVAGSNKRAAATGIIFSSGNIGGAVAGQIYRSEWAPLFVNGHAVNVGCYAIALISVTVLWWSFKRDNRLREDATGKEGNLEKGMLGERLGDLGDRHPQYRYLL